MGYLIGTDEAGYGPNLGPLVISATVWEAPDGVGGEDLFDRLGHVIAPSESAPPCPARGSLPADAVGTARVRHGRLENALFARARACGTWSAGCGRRSDCSTSAREPGATCGGPSPRKPSIRCRPSPGTPITTGRRRWIATRRRLEPLASRCGRAWPRPACGSWRCGAGRSSPTSSTSLVERHGSKGAALSHQTLDLAAPNDRIAAAGAGLGDLRQARRAEPLRRPAGRALPRVVHRNPRRRTPAERYRFGPPDRRVEFCFRVQAESCLPAALASMASKYLRELAMRAFNDFWRGTCPACSRRPAIRKTRSGFAPILPRNNGNCKLPTEFFGGRGDGAEPCPKAINDRSPSIAAG